MGDLGLPRSERRSLSNFLAEHETCGEGFDIQRQAGTEGSVVRVSCNHCGESMEYPAAGSAVSAEEAPAATASSQERRRERSEATPAGDGERRVTPSPKPAEARSAANGGPLASPSPAPTQPLPPAPGDTGSSLWPSWLSTALIAALIGGGLLMIVLGLFGSDENASNPKTPIERSPVASPNAPASQGQGGQPASQGQGAKSGRDDGRSAVGGVAQQVTTGEAAQEQPPTGALTQRSFADRVSVGVPRGWSASVSGGAVTVAEPDGSCQVQVYFEAGRRAEGPLGRETRDFLVDRHPDAKITGPQATREAGRPAQLVRAVYGGGSESAWAFTSGGYTYLALERVSGSAEASAERRADAVVASIRPL